MVCTWTLEHGAAVSRGRRLVKRFRHCHRHGLTIRLVPSITRGIKLPTAYLQLPALLLCQVVFADVSGSESPAILCGHSLATYRDL